MEIKQLKSVSDNLNKYDYLAKADSFIQVTEWENGEGFDITINSRIYSFTRGEIEAIYYLYKSLDYREDEK